MGLLSEVGIILCRYDLEFLKWREENSIT